MATDTLTDDQRELLQRWFDDELDAAEARRAEQLVESSGRARAYVDSLEEVRTATRAVFETTASSAAEQLQTESLVETALEAPPAADLELADLAPLLERYYDGEVTAAERRTVDELRETREDVRNYLDHLDFLAEAVQSARQVAVDGVDLEAVWEGVERDVAFEAHPDDPPRFDPARDQQLLHRYVDGELPESKRALVEAWLEHEDGEAATTVAALEELSTATQTAYEEVGSEVDFDRVWSGVEERLDSGETSETDAGGEADSADVVDFDDIADSQTDGGLGVTDPGPDSSQAASAQGDDSVEWLSGYRQAMVGAAAAALVLVAVGALLGPNLFDNERVVVKEKKTVVIVDSVQYSKGSSVVVDSPMKRVSAGGSDDRDDSGKKKDKPTVIWLLDENKNNGKSDANGDDQAPADAPDDDASETPDAGGPDDADSPSEPDAQQPHGKPI